MPIKDKEKAREYFKTYMANRRKGLTNEKENVKPLEVKPTESRLVKPENKLNPELVKPEEVKPLGTVKPVKPNSEMLNLVKPNEPKHVEPCLLNHHSFTELFQQATTKIKQDYQLIYQDPEASRKCFDCHNLQRNYQILLNLLEKYWKLSKKGEKNM